MLEDTASGQPLVQELTRNSRLPIIPVKPKGDKLARANAVTPLFEAGRIFLPEAAAWKPDYLDDLLMFPDAAHDLTDSTTQALTYLAQEDRGGSQTLLAAYEAVGQWSRPRTKEDVCPEADMMELPLWARGRIRF